METWWESGDTLAVTRDHGDNGGMGGADQVTLWSDYDLYTNIVIVAVQWDPRSAK